MYRRRTALIPMLFRQRRYRSGITLIEMMIVVFIIALLAAFAAPNLHSFVVRTRLTAANDDFVAALNLARSEAVRRGAPVTMVRLGTTPRDWTQGWMMFLDVNGNSLLETGAGDELIREGQPLTSPLTLRTSARTPNAIQFRADGRISSPTNTTFLFCYDNKVMEGTQSRSRAVLVNTSGRVRAGRDSATGLPENEAGTDMNDSNCTNPI